MGIIKKTAINPHGLSNKQQLMISTLVNKAQKGEKLSITDATQQIYNVKNRRNASMYGSETMAKPNFRMALLEALENKGILGADGKIQSKLIEGLEAETFNARGDLFTDYKTRLAYIQEINKITGVYATEKTAKLNINLDLNQQDLKKRLEELKSELEE